MRCVRKWWTLICYAGSASEASIGSRPIGSELILNIGIARHKGQDSPDERLVVDSSLHGLGSASMTFMTAKCISLDRRYSRPSNGMQITPNMMGE